MADRSLEELIWDEQDGELSAEDRGRLEGLLRDSKEARRLRDQVAELARSLEQIEQVESPPALRDRIRRGLAARRASSRPAVTRRAVSTRAPSWLDSLESALRGMSLRPAWVVAATVVLAAGVLFWVWQTGPEVEESRLVGTVNVSDETPAANWLRLPLDSGPGSVALRRQGNQLLIESDLVDAGPARLEVRPLAASGTPVAGDTVDLSAGTLALELDPADLAGLRLEIRAGDELLLERTVTIEEIPGEDPR